VNARRALPVAAWLAALALCAAQIARTHFVADLSSFLPSAPTAEQRLLVEQLREGALSRAMLVGIEGADPGTRARLSRALAQTLRGDARFTTVANGAAAGFEREKALVFANRYALSPNVEPDRFTEEGLRAAIGETLAVLASPAGALVKPLIPRDPTGETLAVLEALRPAAGPRTVEGAWASPDGRRAVLLLRTRARGSDIDAQADAMAAVEAAFAEAAAREGSAARTAQVVTTGPGVFSVRSRAMVERDVVRFSTLGIAIVATLLLAVYRSALALALGLVPVLTGALVGVAAVSLGFGVVHGITLGFGTTLIGEAVDYSIYLFVQAGGGARAGDAAWLAGFWPTIRLGVLTSIAGFSALLLSGLPGLAQLGLYSIAGLAAAAAATRFVLPRLLPPRFEVRDLSAFGARLEILAARATRARLAVAVLAIASLGVLAVRHASVWDSDLASLNPIPAAERALDAELRAALGASDARSLVAIRATDEEAALEAAERVGRELDRAAAKGGLSGYESPARFLPSAGTQRARLASLPDAATLRARLARALAGSPLNARRLEPFIEDVARARDAAPVTRQAIGGTALAAAIDGLLFADADGHWTAVIGLQPPIDAAAVRAAIQASGVRGAAFIDLKGELDRLYGGYLHRALAMSAAGLAAIVALLFAALRTPGRVARVMAPLVAGVAVVAAAHVLAGTTLTILHLVGLLLVVAVGSNYALFFDQLALGRSFDKLAPERPDAPAPGRPDRTAARTLASLALANATTVASFGLLSLSAIPVLHAIGSTVAAGAFLTLVFSAALAAPPARASA
jgi:predicted exporter